MRELWLALGAWGIWLVLASPASAQTQTLMPAQDAISPAAVCLENLSSPTPSAGNAGDPLCAVNLEIGFPTGVRFQHALGEDTGRDWLIEGFAGLEAIFPMAGGGFRRRFTPLCGQHNALVLSPGVDAYILYNSLRDLDWWFSRSRTAFGMVSVDVDLFWHHTLGDRCASQFGFKLGVADAFGAGQAIVPVVSLVFGLRY
jgi:hypothetical protein